MIWIVKNITMMLLTLPVVDCGFDRDAQLDEVGFTDDTRLLQERKWCFVEKAVGWLTVNG
jgi:hypothetical protein